MVSEVAEQVAGFERLHLVMGMEGVEGQQGEATMHLDGQFLMENMFTEMIQTCPPGKVIGSAKTPCKSSPPLFGFTLTRYLIFHHLLNFS